MLLYNLFPTPWLLKIISATFIEETQFWKKDFLITKAMYSLLSSDADQELRAF